MSTRLVTFRKEDTIHLATVYPDSQTCHTQRDWEWIYSHIEATTAGETKHSALVSMAGVLFEKVDPLWLCPDCCGQIRWWLGVTS